MLYIGIDIHRRNQVIAIIPLNVFKRDDNAWKKVKTIAIKNNVNDFESLHIILLKDKLRMSRV
jgi:hypothetical protein